MSKEKKIDYSEPADYFPEETRKACKIGEFADTSKTIKLDEKAIIVLKSLLIQEIDYLGPEIKKHEGEDKKNLQEEQDICIDILSQISR